MVLSCLILGIPFASMTSQPESNQHVLRGTTAFAIAAVDTFHFGAANIVIVRRTSGEPRDVILVKPQALTARNLAAAVRILERLRGSLGDSPEVGAVYRVPEVNQVDEREVEAQSWVDRLLTSRPRALDAFGEVRQVVLHLPNQRK
jgi:hypothetical protein